MEIKIKERRKKSSKLVTDASKVDLSRPKPIEKVSPFLQKYTKAVMQAQAAIEKNNKEEVAKTREKLKNEIHCGDTDKGTL